LFGADTARTHTANCRTVNNFWVNENDIVNDDITLEFLTSLSASNSFDRCDGALKRPVGLRNISPSSSSSSSSPSGNANKSPINIKRKYIENGTEGTIFQAR